MGKHLGPRILEPKWGLLGQNAATRRFENLLEEKWQPPTLEPDGPRKHTIYICFPGEKFRQAPRRGSKFRAGIDVRTGKTKNKLKTLPIVRKATVGPC